MTMSTAPDRHRSPSGCRRGDLADCVAHGGCDRQRLHDGVLLVNAEGEFGALHHVDYRLSQLALRKGLLEDSVSKLSGQLPVIAGFTTRGYRLGQEPSAGSDVARVGGRSGLGCDVSPRRWDAPTPGSPTSITPTPGAISRAR